MTTPGNLLRRRRPRPRPTSRPPRPRIVDVTNRWDVTDHGPRRVVLVQLPDGTMLDGTLADDHPALVAFLDRAAARYAAAVSA